MFSPEFLYVERMLNIIFCNGGSRAVQNVLSDDDLKSLTLLEPRSCFFVNGILLKLFE